MALAHWTRPCRVAAWKVGLISDPTRAAARAVERLIDTRGRELFAASGVPGLAALVRFAGGPVIRRGFGTAGDAGPMTTDTVFQVLSLGKAVTALCALALAERGTLALDEPVWGRMRRWRMPARRSGGFSLEGVTLRRLLSHGAGLSGIQHGFAEAGEVPDPMRLLERDDDEQHTLRMVAPPDGTFRYAGAGYLIVQVLIEDATGRRFQDVARETVLQPLGMASSDFDRTPALAARLSARYDATGKPYPFAPLQATGPSGLYSTAEDIGILQAALAPGPKGEPAGRGVVSEATCAQMRTSQSVDADGAAYGLALHLRRKRSDLRYMHDGYWFGWYHHAEGFLRRRVVVVLLSNGDRGRHCVPLLTRELRHVIYDRAL